MLCGKSPAIYNFITRIHTPNPLLPLRDTGDFPHPMAAPKLLSLFMPRSRPLTEESPPELGPRGLLPSLLPFFHCLFALLFGIYIFTMSGTIHRRLFPPVLPLLATPHQWIGWTGKDGA